MTQQRLNTFFNYYYRDPTGIRRRYGIYCPAIDRFIHISDQDLWMTLETAEILSSKIQTMVYVLPPGYIKIPEHTEIISNQNCLNWGIYDKSNLKVGSGSALGARQTPTIGMLYPDDKLEEHSEFPEDFRDDPSILLKLKEYANYVYKRVTCITLAVHTYNPYFSKKFVDKYINEDWAKHTESKYDPSTSKGLEKDKIDPDTPPVGIELEFKRILYHADSVHEAEEQILDFWYGNYFAAGFIMFGYYRVLGEPIPKELKPFASNIHYFNHSVWVI